MGPRYGERRCSAADLMSSTELQEQCRTLLSAVVSGIRISGPRRYLRAPGWECGTRAVCGRFPCPGARQGFSAGRSGDVRPFAQAAALFSFDSPCRTGGQPGSSCSTRSGPQRRLVDRLALITTEAYIAMREELIVRQQQELLELSTPVVKLWDGILALPIIGTLDSARTQVVMENLLQTVVATNSKFAIIDITGVPTVDTLVAQHLLKTITAARLMGAECIISGVRPQIAQTIVHLGINLEDVITKAKLSDAFALALQRSGRMGGQTGAGADPPASPVFSQRRRTKWSAFRSSAWGHCLLVTIQVDMHDKLATAAAGRRHASALLTTESTGCADRYLIPGNRGFLYRAHACESGGHDACTGRQDGGGRQCSRLLRLRSSNSACRCPACKPR